MIGLPPFERAAPRMKSNWPPTPESRRNMVRLNGRVSAPGGSTRPETTELVGLSVVIPVYGCAGCLRALHERLTAALSPLALPYELVFVDDGSTDGGYAILEELAAENESL